jgi:GAF domain-containing protein
LSAANSEGGRRMLERQHQLKLDANSIVGYSTSRGEPRIALDVGTDAVFFNNPDLPDTRSEMALPLRIGNNVIGALDVQSLYANAFSEDDIATLSTLADQIAIAIENARLFSESREALKESEDTFSRYVKREWNSFTAQAKSTGYLFDGNRTIPLDAKDRRKKIKSLPQTGRLTLEKDARELAIPIRLRGQVIGYLDVKPRNDNRKWTQDDIVLLEAAAERAALALENARLVETAQRRASREQTIGEISTRIGAVSNLDAIMQAAVEELGRKIGGATEVTFELETEHK